MYSQDWRCAEFQESFGGDFHDNIRRLQARIFGICGYFKRWLNRESNRYVLPPNLGTEMSRLNEQFAENLMDLRSDFIQRTHAINLLTKTHCPLMYKQFRKLAIECHRIMRQILIKANVSPNSDYIDNFKSLQKYRRARNKRRINDFVEQKLSTKFNLMELNQQTKQLVINIALEAIEDAEKQITSALNVFTELLNSCQTRHCNYYVRQTACYRNYITKNKIQVILDRRRKSVENFDTPEIGINDTEFRKIVHVFLRWYDNSLQSIEEIASRSIWGLISCQYEVFHDLLE